MDNELDLVRPYILAENQVFLSWLDQRRAFWARVEAMERYEWENRYLFAPLWVRPWYWLVDRLSVI